MTEKLWVLEGKERLDAIDNMKLSEYDEICRSSRHCSECPLAILYHDLNGFARLLCVDVATKTRIHNALKYGGRFLKKGEKLNDER